MPRATRTVSPRKYSYVQIRGTSGVRVLRDRLAGKAAVTRWHNRLGRDVGTVLNEWTVDDGRPQPDWVTAWLAANVCPECGSRRDDRFGWTHDWQCSRSKARAANES